MRRFARILSTALITAGLVVLLDVAVTLAWKEPVSSIYGSIQQGDAEDQLAQLEAEFPTAGDLEAIGELESVKAKARALAGRFAEEIERGEGIGRIRIPAIGAEYVLIQGTDTSSLQKGPGHYPDTRLPGQGGSVGIAGHRTTYLAPFRKLDQLEDGDEVVLEMPYASFSYAVEDTRIVDPEDYEIVRNRGYERAVLTACHPLYSAAQRIAVFARLDSISLFAAGDREWPDP